MKRMYEVLGLKGELARNFAIVSECAKYNAGRGYNQAHLFLHNQLVKEMMEKSGGDMQGMIDLAGQIGWFVYYGNACEVNKLALEFKVEAICRGYIN